MTAIRSWEDAVEWRPTEGHINPILVRESLRDMPDPELFSEHYCMFNLAVEFLLAEDGWGRSYSDVKSLWGDLAAGIAFDEAFEARFGLFDDVIASAFFNLIENWMTG